jgi:prolyl oligopeptidase
MRRKVCFCVLAFSAVSLAAFSVAIQAQPASGSAAIALPVAAVKPVVDDYFGTKVSDPYRYMEALKDPEVQAWFKGQNDYARATLAALPGRAKLLARIQELDQSVPLVDAERFPGDLYVV